MENCAIFEVASFVWLLLIGFVSANTPQPADLYHVGRSSQDVYKKGYWDNSDFCHLQAKSGICRAGISKFYYDVNKGYCKEFAYGGCGGNANRFDSEHSCYERCRGAEVISNPFILDDEFSTCEWQPNPGNCYALIPQYYYDVNANACKLFTYGGCGGNANRFPDEESCIRKCIQYRHTKKY
ncbi:boophilin-H2-like [Pectinophora gossypiella]|uniref:boophilin-H2-like n=1 Tax=Pectinophora gossypiella TaxID=13191 RepID=UPI00214EA123|nr:boophilin-H2-like [Pectinophora gossypiella]